MNTISYEPGSNAQEISAALANADADDAGGSVLVTVAGKALCAGGNFAESAVFERALEGYKSSVRWWAATAKRSSACTN